MMRWKLRRVARRSFGAMPHEGAQPVSLFYKLLYQFGMTPWEEDPLHGAAAEQISTLFAREESCRKPSDWSVLDLGCGRGIWSIRLAERGWKVTGVDVIPKAITGARERAKAAGVDARFVEGNVTALRAANVGSDFRFVLDFECFNHLNDVQRKAVGREVSAVAGQDATILMLVWAPGRRGPFPPGASRSNIEAAFPGWKIINEDVYAARESLPEFLKKTDLRFYGLGRAESFHAH
jgi:SAM-dependent methyltransferase